MMIRNISVFILLLILSGCGHGLVGKLPTIDDPNYASEMVFIRECEYVRYEGVLLISIDGDELFRIGPCQYTVFNLKSGQHNILMEGFVVNYGLNVNLLPGHKYYYLATVINYDISSIPDNIAISKIIGFTNKDKYLQIDNTIGPISDQ